MKIRVAPAALNDLKEIKAYIENDLSLLDEAGEFYFDKNTSEIYYKPRYEGELSNSGFIPATKGLLEISGTSLNEKTENIIFENLDFRYGAWNDTNNLGFCNIQADQYKDADGITKRLHSQINVNMADGIQIKNSTFEFFGSSAISLEDSVTNTKITQNVIKDISGTAVVIGSWERNAIGDEAKMCREIIVKDNIIRRIGNEYFSSPAISVYYENSVDVSHNDISDTPYTGISVGWGWGTNDVIGTGNINITHNRISDVCSSDLWDGAHIYTLGHLKDSRISDNYFGKSDQSDHGGVYTDSGTAYLNVYNNVFDGANKWFFTGWYLTHNLNVYDNYATSQLYETRGENNSYEDAILIENVNSNQAAYAIYEKAGITWDCRDTELNFFNLTKTEKISDAKLYTRSGWAKPQKESDSLVLNGGVRVEYDIFAEKEGLYDIYVISGGNSDSNVYCTVNDGMNNRINIKASSDEKKFLITAYFKEGMNTLKFGSLSGTLYAKWISFDVNDGEKITPGLLNYTDAYSLQPEGSHLSFQPGDWIEYEISANESGWYNFYAVVTNPPSWGIKVTVNDATSPDIQKMMDAVIGSELPVSVGRVYLEKGSNKLRIANGGGYYYFDGCILEKMQTSLDSGTVEIPATNYFIGYSAYGIGTGNAIHYDIKWEGGNLSFQPNDYAEYIVYAKESGTYKLSISMGCPSEMRTQVSLNDIVVFNSTNKTYRSDYATQYFDIGNMQLKEGKNVIRIKNTKGSRYFSAFKLTKLSS